MDVASAAVQGGSNLLGNVLGYFSNKENNKFNAEQAQINRDFQEQMWNKQVAYNNEMWEKQAKYSSAQEQVKRLKEAGLNPALALGQVASGQASSPVGNAVGNPQGSTATGQPFRPDFSSLGSIFQTMLQQQLGYEDVREKQLDNAYKRASFAIKLQKDMSEARKYLHDADIAKIDSEWRHQINSSDWQLNWAKTQTQEAQTENLMAQTSLLKQQFKYLPQKLQLEVSLLDAQIKNQIAQKHLTYKQADKVVEEKLTEIQRRTGIKLDNYIKFKAKEDILRTYKNAGDTSNPYFMALMKMLPSFGLDYGYSRKDNNYNSSK